MQTVRYASLSKSDRCIGICCTGLDPALTCIEHLHHCRYRFNRTFPDWSNIEGCRSRTILMVEHLLFDLAHFQHYTGLNGCNKGLFYSIQQGTRRTLVSCFFKAELMFNKWYILDIKFAIIDAFYRYRVLAGTDVYCEVRSVLNHINIISALGCIDAK